MGFVDNACYLFFFFFGNCSTFSGCELKYIHIHIHNVYIHIHIHIKHYLVIFDLIYAAGLVEGVLFC